VVTIWPSFGGCLILAVHGYTGQKTGGSSHKPYDHAAPGRLRLSHNVVKTPGCEQLIHGLTDVVGAEKGALFQRLHSRQVGRMENVSGGVLDIHNPPAEQAGILSTAWRVEHRKCQERENELLRTHVAMTDCMGKCFTRDTDYAATDQTALVQIQGKA